MIIVLLHETEYDPIRRFHSGNVLVHDAKDSLVWRCNVPVHGYVLRTKYEVVMSTISSFSSSQEGVVIIHDFIEKKQQTAFISPVDSTLRRLVHLQPSAAHRTQPTNLRIVESTESHQPPENIHHRRRR